MGNIIISRIDRMMHFAEEETEQPQEQQGQQEFPYIERMTGKLINGTAAEIQGAILHFNLIKTIVGSGFTGEQLNDTTKKYRYMVCDGTTNDTINTTSNLAKTLFPKLSTEALGTAITAIRAHETTYGFTESRNKRFVEGVFDSEKNNFVCVYEILTDDGKGGKVGTEFYQNLYGQGMKYTCIYMPDDGKLFGADFSTIKYVSVKIGKDIYDKNGNVYQHLPKPNQEQNHESITKSLNELDLLLDSILNIANDKVIDNKELFNDDDRKNLTSIFNLATELKPLIQERKKQESDKNYSERGNFTRESDDLTKAIKAIGEVIPNTHESSNKKALRMATHYDTVKNALDKAKVQLEK